GGDGTPTNILSEYWIPTRWAASAHSQSKINSPMLWSLRYNGQRATILPPFSTTKWCGSQPVSSLTQPVCSNLANQSHFMKGEPEPNRPSHVSRGTAETLRTILIANSLLIEAILPRCRASSNYRKHR